VSAKVTIIEKIVPPQAAVGNIETPIAILSPVAAAFQQDAFQSNAFQMSPVTPTSLTAQAYPAAVTVIETVPG
jgi:hypothetical protein